MLAPLRYYAMAVLWLAMLLLLWCLFGVAQAAPILFQADPVTGAVGYQTCLDPTCTEQACPNTAKKTSFPVVTLWLEPGTDTCIYMRAVDVQGQLGQPQRLQVTLRTLVDAQKQTAGYIVETRP